MRETRHVTLLAGGVGAAKFVRGLVAVLDERRLKIISNTADDIELHGLTISPDVDTLLYTLAGLADTQKGWGIHEDTFETLAALAKIGEETWFRLGDRDIATHLVRTHLRKEGRSATEITKFLAKKLNVRAEILPMTDETVFTEVQTPQGWMHFQEFFVKLACRPDILGVAYRGIDAAKPTPEALEAIEQADAIVICPSNPIASIGPILELKGVKDALKKFRGPKIAVSPIVAGKALKGPADRMLSAAGFSADAVGVARFYKGLIDGLVIDRVDVHLAPDIHALGLEVLVTDTIMNLQQDSERLAAETMEFLSQNRSSKTNIVIPVKNPAAAKQRLGELLDAGQRRQLALALVDQVLQILSSFAGRCGILVVTDSEEIVERVRPLGVAVLFETVSQGETAAVNRATRWSIEHGFDRQIVIPGDLPCLAPQDIETLLNLPAESPALVLSPATGDDGTNAITTSPPDVLTFRFGAKSFPDYLDQARRKNIPCRVLRLPSLVLDLDTPEDVKTFLDMETDSTTHRLLASWIPRASTAPHAG